MATKRVEKLHQKISSFLNTYPLGVAGRMLYFDTSLNAFVIAMHTTSREQTHEKTQGVFNNLPETIKSQLAKHNFGFAGKQI